MNEQDTFIARGMARIHKAIVDAPSHMEIEAGFEAMLRHLVNPNAEDEPETSAAKMASVSMLHANLPART